jgi:hypothetical protein
LTSLKEYEWLKETVETFKSNFRTGEAIKKDNWNISITIKTSLKTCFETIATLFETIEAILATIETILETLETI